jgi:hypothetical protein
LKKVGETTRPLKKVVNFYLSVWLLRIRSETMTKNINEKVLKVLTSTNTAFI